MKAYRRLSILIVLLALGCGKTDADKFLVTGLVTYQGKPLPLGSLMFVPEGRGMHAEIAEIGSDGRYQLKAAPGKYLVQVQMNAQLRGGPAATGEDAKLNLPKVDWLIPEKYTQFQTSGLEVIVEPKETNQADLSMQ